MGYCTIRLTPYVQQLCTIITPWGKYSYCRLRMGIMNSPDIFQSQIAKLIAELDEFTRTYLDDLLTITKGDFHDHLNKLEKYWKNYKTRDLKSLLVKVILWHKKLNT